MARNTLEDFKDIWYRSKCYKNYQNTLRKIVYYRRNIANLNVLSYAYLLRYPYGSN